MDKEEKIKKPEWLKIKITDSRERLFVENILDRRKLVTVCREAGCPNLMECFSKKTATFMILGSICTRNCRFCKVESGVPGAPSPDEPGNVAEAVKELSLKHVVITSVTRDDLADGGASHFADTVIEIRKTSPGVTIELLIPDMKGDTASLEKIINSKPEIINHNLETVRRLYPDVRPQADYQQSLDLLRIVKKYDKRIYTKSGIMAGLGEHKEELEELFLELREADCDFLTIGQYLPPTPQHLPVSRFLRPEEFEELKGKALSAGFVNAASAPFVRSSYMAREMLNGRN